MSLNEFGNPDFRPSNPVGIAKHSSNPEGQLRSLIDVTKSLALKPHNLNHEAPPRVSGLLGPLQLCIIPSKKNSASTYLPIDSNGHHC